MQTKISSDHTNNPIYIERVFSNRTETLFLSLMFISFLLLLWRLNTVRWDFFTATFLFFFILFFFYSLNYRILVIELTSKSLKLKFGIFTWTVPMENIEDYRLDEIPFLMRMGGAGIHFMVIRQRYRASFNFLEYPRIVISLKRKVGPVRDLSFTTQNPKEVLRLIQDLVPTNANA
jgi:hypothetical protein